MPYIIPEKRLAVFFSPKCAGTSVRGLMFELENGRPFEPYRLQGRDVDANALIGNFRFRRVPHKAIRDFHRIAIIRDPVRRFLSAYSNRVVHYGELSEAVLGEDAAKFGVTPDPDLDTFVRHIGRYATISRSVRRHTLSQQRFLGQNTGYFHAVFRVEDLGAFPRHLEDRYNCPPLTLPRLQTGGPKIRPEDVATDTLLDIEAIVQNDIAYSFHPEYRDGQSSDLRASA